MVKMVKKAIRQRKIIIKTKNNIDNVLPVPATPPQYTITGKVSLASLIAKQRVKLSQSQSNRQGNVSKEVNVENNNSNNNNQQENNQQSNNSDDSNKSSILTGKAAVQAMKNDPKVSNIIQNKKSYFVTNKLIEQKETEAITTKKHRLFNKQLRKLQETSINVIGINWKRGKKYGGIECDTCVVFYVQVKQHPEFINCLSGDGSKTYKPIVLLSHLSSLRHLDALKTTIDKNSLMARCQALLRIWESGINNFSALREKQQTTQTKQ